MSNIQIEEVLWVALAAIGVLTHAKGAFESFRDMTALRIAQRNGMRRRIARGSIRNELTRLVKQAGFIVVGAIAMTNPPPPGGRSLAGWITVGIFFYAEAVMVINSILDNYDRIALNHELSKNQ